MAEVAGLALGTVALVTLYSSCLDLINCIESGKNYVDDYGRVCTKLCLLKRRLLDWGQASSIAAPPGHGDEFLPIHWFEDQQQVVRRSLSDIYSIFRNTSILVEKYKAKEKSASCVRRALTSRSLKTLPAPDQKPCNEARGSSLSLLRRRTTWAIHDKQQLDNSIQELDFLIRNLEIITCRLRMSGSRRQDSHNSIDSGYAGSIVESPKSEIFSLGADAQLALYRADQRAKDPSAQLNPATELSQRPINNNVNVQPPHKPAEQQAQTAFTLSNVTTSGNTQIGHGNSYHAPEPTKLKDRSDEERTADPKSLPK